ncbi:MAG: hypothetical protein HYW88_02420, partial [Candidatus Sungbacteria bacterium]|nr:hypothetical protein [Candidatus Sungbacteria bacterium]
LEEAIRVTEIGQKMEGPQSALIEYLVGMGIKSIGIREAINIIQTTKLLNNELLPYYAQLEKFKQNEEGLEKILKGDYQMFSWIIDQAVKGITDGQHIPLRGLESLNPSEVKYLQKHSYFFEPNNTKKIYAEETRKQLKNVEKPCGQISKPNRKYLTPRNSFIKFMLTENVIGKILRDVTFVSFDGIFPKKCQEDFLVSTAQTLIAIKAYHNDTNAFPNSLTELVPKYLSKVPEDPFSGGQLRYSKDKKIIYSVGLNLTDVGGSNSKDWNSLYQDDDPTIKIDF